MNIVSRAIEKLVDRTEILRVLQNRYTTKTGMVFPYLRSPHEIVQTIIGGSGGKVAAAVIRLGKAVIEDAAGLSSQERADAMEAINAGMLLKQIANAEVIKQNVVDEAAQEYINIAGSGDKKLIAQKKAALNKAIAERDAVVNKGLGYRGRMITPAQAIAAYNDLYSMAPQHTKNMLDKVLAQAEVEYKKSVDSQTGTLLSPAPAPNMERTERSGILPTTI